MKNKTRYFNEMNYCEVQRHNSQCRHQLSTEDQKWLKQNNYKNIGWDNVINLYYKIKEFVEKVPLPDLTLEELFLEADRIGSKYLTSQEIQEFNQKLSEEVQEISDLIDRHFPDTEIEIIDFGNKTNNKTRKKLSRSIKF